MCVILRLVLVACFTALGTDCMFCHAWHRLHVFPHLAPVACFATLGTGCMFSRTWHRLHVLPHLALIACFATLGTDCMFSRTWHRLHVLSRLARYLISPYNINTLQADRWRESSIREHWRLMMQAWIYCIYLPPNYLNK